MVRWFDRSMFGVGKNGRVRDVNVAVQTDRLAQSQPKTCGYSMDFSGSNVKGGR